MVVKAVARTLGVRDIDDNPSPEMATVWPYA